MFIIHWMFNKLGYKPKVTVDSSWPFPTTKEDKDFFCIDRPAKKTVAKKKPAAKKAVRKSVRKKA